MFNQNQETIDIDANPIQPCGKELLAIIRSIPNTKSRQHNRTTFAIK